MRTLKQHGNSLAVEAVVNTSKFFVENCVHETVLEKIQIQDCYLHMLENLLLVQNDAFQIIQKFDFLRCLATLIIPSCVWKCSIPK